jgi:hypothetical protein
VLIVATIMPAAVGAMFLLLVAYAQSACPLSRCNGENGDVWMLPFFAAPIGVPAIILTIILAIITALMAARGRRS